MSAEYKNKRIYDKNFRSLKIKHCRAITRANIFRPYVNSGDINGFFELSFYMRVFAGGAHRV